MSLLLDHRFADGLGPFEIIGQKVPPPTAVLDPTNVEVSGKSLKIHVRPGADGIWRGGEVMIKAPLVPPVRIVARMRLRRGQDTKGLGMLWPADGIWPPEIDWFETGVRTETHMTLHYGENNTMVHRTAPCAANGLESLSEYARWGVEWREGHLKFLLNGQESRDWIGPNDIFNAGVPTAPMTLRLRAVKHPSYDNPTSGVVLEVSHVLIRSLGQ